MSAVLDIISYLFRHQVKLKSGIFYIRYFDELTSDFRVVILRFVIDDRSDDLSQACWQKSGVCLAPGFRVDARCR